MMDPDYDSDRVRLANLVRGITRHVGVLKFGSKSFLVESCAVLMDSSAGCDFILQPWKPQADGSSVPLPEICAAKIVHMRPDRLQVVDVRGRTFVLEPLTPAHGDLYSTIQRWREQLTVIPGAR